MRALVIVILRVDKILDGEKTWEIRGSRTKVRGQIGLIASGSGTVIGVGDLMDCVGPLTNSEFRRNARRLECARARRHWATIGRPLHGS